ncbi:MAG: hypothetical protein ACI8W7_005116 [Gammaproteobacteria bacterium]|jgi:hypothetical protein
MTIAVGMAMALALTTAIVGGPCNLRDFDPQDLAGE